MKVMEDDSIKVADWGLAKSMANIANTPFIGTNYWMAPELLPDWDGPIIDTSTGKVDVYSFGIVLWELFCGHGTLPYNLSDFGGFPALHRRVVAGMRPLQCTRCPKRLRDLMDRCWAKMPEDRPGWDFIIGELRLAEKEANSCLWKKESDEII